MKQIDFLLRVGKLASNVFGTGLFPSVLLAQAALESGWGQSILANKFNNLFGIKADKSWKGETVILPTREVLNGKTVTIEQPFRVYSNASDSFSDRNKFLKKNPRYTKAGVFEAKTPESQAIALQTAGYATDPGYAAAIIKIINTYDLKRFDVEGKKKG